jgi:hypothetical protein
MPDGCDLCVSEILDCAVIGEGAIPSINDAKMRLLKAAGKVIPARAMLRAQLLFVPPQPCNLSIPLTSLFGIDVSEWNRFRSGAHEQIALAGVTRTELSPVFDVFEFDFANAEPLAKKRNLRRELKTMPGVCNAVAFWFLLSLDDEVVIDTAPDAPMTSWKQGILFLEDGPVQISSETTVVCRHDASRLYFDVVPE